jgi:molybdopterin-guanine dinucleotide biosynthesis protein A
MHLTIAILAGGASSRMGRDKALLPVGSETMLGRMVRTATDTQLPVIVIGRERPEGWSLKNALFTIDESPGEGPLAALATAIRSAGGDVLLLPCDMPFITADALDWLVDAGSNRHLRDGLIVRNGGRIEPLFSVYRKSVLPMVEMLLASGTRSMMALIEAGNFDFIDAPEPVAGGLRNINTQSDYDALTGG